MKIELSKAKCPSPRKKKEQAMKKQRGTNEKKENNTLKVINFLHFEQGEYKLNESFNPSLFNIWFAPQLYIL